MVGERKQHKKRSLCAVCCAEGVQDSAEMREEIRGLQFVQDSFALGVVFVLSNQSLSDQIRKLLQSKFY